MGEIEKTIISLSKRYFPFAEYKGNGIENVINEFIFTNQILKYFLVLKICVLNFGNAFGISFFADFECKKEFAEKYQLDSIVFTKIDSKSDNKLSYSFRFPKNANVLAISDGVYAFRTLDDLNFLVGSFFNVVSSNIEHGRYVKLLRDLNEGQENDPYGAILSLAASCVDNRFQRGYDYYQNHRVSDFNLSITEKGDVLSALVHGHYGNYVSSITIKENRITHHSCNCPAHAHYSGLCKHNIATLLTLCEAFDYSTGCNQYSVLCNLNSKTLDAQQIVVFAKDVDDAEKEAIKFLKENGYKDGQIACGPKEITIKLNQTNVINKAPFFSGVGLKFEKQISQEEKNHEKSIKTFNNELSSLKKELKEFKKTRIETVKSNKKSEEAKIYKLKYDNDTSMSLLEYKISKCMFFQKKKKEKLELELNKLNNIRKNYEQQIKDINAKYKKEEEKNNIDLANLKEKIADKEKQIEEETKALHDFRVAND